MPKRKKATSATAERGQTEGFDVACVDTKTYDHDDANTIEKSEHDQTSQVDDSSCIIKETINQQVTIDPPQHLSVVKKKRHENDAAKSLILLQTNDNAVAGATGTTGTTTISTTNIWNDNRNDCVNRCNPTIASTDDTTDANQANVNQTVASAVLAPAPARAATSSQVTSSIASSTEEEEWMKYIRKSKLVHIGLRGDVQDSVFVSYGLCIPILLQPDDRIGKYKHRDIHYVGYACHFCYTTSTLQLLPGFGKYYPNSYNSLLNGTNTSSLIQHFISHCRTCPPNIRTIISNLYHTEQKQQEKQAITAKDETTTTTTNTTSNDKKSSPSTSQASTGGANRPKYGSKKRFFTYIWNQLRTMNIQELLEEQKNISSLKVDATTVLYDKNIHPQTTKHLSNHNNDDVDHNDQGSINDNGATTSTIIDTNVPKSLLTNEQEELLIRMIENSEIVTMDDRFLVSDITLLAMSQLKKCTVTPSDQIGRCKNHNIGYIGLCCLYCNGKAGKPGYGRYFPSSLRSLAQADSCQQIIKHIINKCNHCPNNVKQLLIALSNDINHNTINSNDIIKDQTNNDNNMNESIQQDIDNIIDNITTKPVEPNVTNTTPFVTKGKSKSLPTKYNINNNNLQRIQYGSRKIFFRRIWMRLHGNNSSDIAEMTSPSPTPISTNAVDVEHNENINDTLDTNETKINLVEAITKTVNDKETETVNISEASTTNPSIASAPPLNSNSIEDSTMTTTVTKASELVPINDVGPMELPWDRIVGTNNKIVNIDIDRGLISDLQLVAISQMDICYVTEQDKIGWFKDRMIGFAGLCCVHCRGRPSFGRYFPNSVRSLAQTTSSQTIISHIALYCPNCPQFIRDIVLQLQRNENSTDVGNNDNSISGKTTYSSNYGSRKVFFDRVWSRIHPSSAVAKSHPPLPINNIENPTTTFDHMDNATIIGSDDPEGMKITTATSTTTMEVTMKNVTSETNSTPLHDDNATIKDEQQEPIITDNDDTIDDTNKQ